MGMRVPDTITDFGSIGTDVIPTAAEIAEVDAPQDLRCTGPVLEISADSARKRPAPHLCGLGIPEVILQVACARSWITYSSRRVQQLAWATSSSTGRAD